jgi:hypothetical protein
MLGPGQRADSAFDVFPTTLVIEGAPHRRLDERAALPLTDPTVERTHDVVVQAYVQTHGHTLAHSRVPNRQATSHQIPSAGPATTLSHGGSMALPENSFRWSSCLG